MVLAPEFQLRFFEGPKQNPTHTFDPVVAESMGQVEVVPTKTIKQHRQLYINFNRPGFIMDMTEHYLVFQLVPHFLSPNHNHFTLKIAVPTKQGSPHHWKFSKVHMAFNIAYAYNFITKLCML